MPNIGVLVATRVLHNEEALLLQNEQLKAMTHDMLQCMKRTKGDGASCMLISHNFIPQLLTLVYFFHVY